MAVSTDRGRETVEANALGRVDVLLDECARTFQDSEAPEDVHPFLRLFFISGGDTGEGNGDWGPDSECENRVDGCSPSTREAGRLINWSAGCNSTSSASKPFHGVAVIRDVEPETRGLDDNVDPGSGSPSASSSASV